MKYLLLLISIIPFFCQSQTVNTKYNDRPQDADLAFLISKNFPTRNMLAEMFVYDTELKPSLRSYFGPDEGFENAGSKYNLRDFGKDLGLQNGYHTTQQMLSEMFVYDNAGKPALRVYSSEGFGGGGTYSFTKGVFAYPGSNIGLGGTINDSTVISFVPDGQLIFEDTTNGFFEIYGKNPLGGTFGKTLLEAPNGIETPQYNFSVFGENSTLTTKGINYGSIDFVNTKIFQYKMDTAGCPNNKLMCNLSFQGYDFGANYAMSEFVFSPTYWELRVTGIDKVPAYIKADTAGLMNIYAEDIQINATNSFTWEAPTFGGKAYDFWNIITENDSSRYESEIYSNQSSSTAQMGIGIKDSLRGLSSYATYSPYTNKIVTYYDGDTTTEAASPADSSYFTHIMILNDTLNDLRSIEFEIDSKEGGNGITELGATKMRLTSNQRLQLSGLKIGLGSQGDKYADRKGMVIRADADSTAMWQDKDQWSEIKNISENDTLTETYLLGTDGIIYINNTNTDTVDVYLPQLGKSKEIGIYVNSSSTGSFRINGDVAATRPIDNGIFILSAKESATLVHSPAINKYFVTSIKLEP